MTIRQYKFTIDQSEREAIHCSLSYNDALSVFDYEYLSKELKKSEITLTDRQLSGVLSGIYAHVEYMMNVSDDWLRAVEHRDARERIIQKTRAQMESVKEASSE